MKKVEQCDDGCHIPVIKYPVKIWNVQTTVRCVCVCVCGGGGGGGGGVRVRSALE